MLILVALVSRPLVLNGNDLKLHGSRRVDAGDHRVPKFVQQSLAFGIEIVVCF